MWPYLKNNEKNCSVFGEARTSDEIDEQSFGRTVFFFAHEYLYQTCGRKETNINSNSSFIRFRRWSSPIIDVVCSIAMLSIISKMFLPFWLGNK